MQPGYDHSGSISEFWNWRLLYSIKGSISGKDATMKTHATQKHTLICEGSQLPQHFSDPEIDY